MDNCEQDMGYSSFIRLAELWLIFYPSKNVFPYNFFCRPWYLVSGTQARRRAEKFW